MSNGLGFVAYRAVTCPLRMMPNFLVIGAHRGGTSAFYHYLTEHPNIAAATTKEVNFFNRNFHKGTWWYKAHFPSLAYKRVAEIAHQSGLITGEASPYYLFHPLVPERVARTLPCTKLIALLRNPVDRAHSQYRRYVYRGWETSTFEEAITSEELRLRSITGAGRAVSDDPQNVVGHSSYLARGMYAEQLQRWFNLFPREQILILRSEDFYADPAAVLKQALAFLDVSLERLPTKTQYSHHDGYGDPNESRGDVSMDSALRERLNGVFAPYSDRLYKMIGRDMKWA